MAKRVNYRKLYEDYYNISIPDRYDIHHIDRDRGNNEIDNLILLPKELHNRYHKVFPPIVDCYEISYKINLCSDLPLSNAEEAVKVMMEISNWVLLKLTRYSGTNLQRRGGNGSQL